MALEKTINTEINHELSAQLQACLSKEGQAIIPGDEAYDTARQAWNLAIDQYPAIIVDAATPQDIVEALAFARAQDLKVAVKTTGHGVIRKADHSLLINTSKMAATRVDALSQTAWVSAGTKWEAVLEAAQAAGLAPLLGSSPGVGAIGYTLGGGMGWLARKYGLSTDSVNYFDLVTANGELVRASASENPDLFWGLRGGGGNFGVVTGMEIRLYPVTHVYAGNLYFPITNAKAVFAHYREWIKDVPDELTSSIAIMNFPPFPQIPEMLRGQSFVIIRGCFCGPLDLGENLLCFWRDWQTPLIDDFRVLPFLQAGSISNDPVDPVPGLSSGAWLKDLSDATAEIILKNVVPTNGPPLLMAAEIRHAGGAIAAVDPQSAAYGNRDAQFGLQMVGITPSPDIRARVIQSNSRFKQDLTPHLHGGVYLNFLEGDEARERTRQGFSAEAFQKLQSLKAQFDPQNRLNHSFEIPPGK